MKKVFITVSALFVILWSMNSCKKDGMVQPQNETNVNYTKMILGKIDHFRNLMSDSYKSGGSMELDSAVWYLEATLSYDNAYPDSISKDFTLFHSTYTINVSNGMVSEDDVEVVYDQMEDSLYYYLSSIDAEHKFIAFADVQLNGVENNVAELEMISGYGYNLVLGTYVPFEEDDDWIWGTLGEDPPNYPPVGKCDGTMVGVSDGSNELEWRFNNPQCAPAGNIAGYTNYVTEEATGFQFVDQFGNHRIYVDYDHILDNCLFNEDLTYYLVEGDDIIHTYDYEGGLKPAGKNFISIEIVDEMTYGQYYSYFHLYYVTYATPIPGLPD